MTRPQPNAADVQEAIPSRQYTWPELLRRLWPIVRPHRGRIAWITVTVTLVGLGLAIQPLFAKPILDNAIPHKPLTLGMGSWSWDVPYQGVALAWAVVLSFLGLMGLRMLFWYIGQVQANWLLDHLLFGLRHQGFAHAQRLCQRFHHRYTPGKLYERIFGQSVLSVQMLVMIFSQQIVVTVTGTLLSLAFCIWLSPPLTVLVLSGAIFYTILSRIIGPRIYAKSQRINSFHGEVTDYVMDHIRGVKAVQAQALEDEVIHQFDQRVWELHRQYNKFRLESLRMGFMTESLGYLLSGAVLLAGAYLAVGEQIEVGTLVAFIGYQGTLVWTMNVMANAFTQFASTKAGLDQFFSIMDTDSTVQDPPGAVMPERVTGELALEGVTFGYREGEPVLRGLSLTIPRGQHVALVGRSGSGKSTIFNLLMRFHDPDQGRVLLDGRDIRTLPLKGYRNLFGMVLQEPYLFNTTIAENLRYAKRDATDEELILTLERANAWSFVQALPERLNYRVGEAGRNLSGGQRSRIAVARCMLLNAPILLLDEPTAALDNEAQAAVLLALNRLCEGRTVLTISHRLSTTRSAQRILVLDRGQVVQDGDFEDLVQRPGIFRMLYENEAYSSPQTVGTPDEN